MPLVALLAAASIFGAAWDPSIVNDPRTCGTVGPGSSGPAALRAQILLDRAHFSPGEIDGRYQDNTRAALFGFQASRKLRLTGIVDDATWRSLNADRQPVLSSYTIAPSDVKGPFFRIPPSMADQARLKWLGYQSPDQELGERFHIDPRLLAELNPGKLLGKAGEKIVVPHVQRDEGLPMAFTIVISKSNRALTAFTAGGRIIAQYPATMGSIEDPMPIGELSIGIVEYNPSFFYNPKLFWNPLGFKTKIVLPPGPNSPVGRIWIGLSNQVYGIHGTPAPGRIGQTETRGCIRLANWDVLELSEIVRKGTPVLLKN